MTPTLAAWLHTCDPIVFHITGAWAVRWYGLAYVAGFAAGWWILRWCSRRGMTPLSELRVADLLLAGVAGVVLGGRLGYVLFYNRSLLWTFEDGFPWWGVLMIQKGGMASHGGMIGVAVACWMVSRGTKNPDGTRAGRVPALHVMDLMALGATPGLMFGRLANFVNGELLGEIVALPGKPAPWWSVKFPQEILSGHDAQFSMVEPDRSERLEAIRRLADQVKLPSDNPDRAVERLIERVQHGSKELAAQLEPLISARHPSQLYQAAAEGLVLGLILLMVWRRPRVPGVIGAWFLMAYGVMRIATEFARLPDAGLGRQGFLGIELSRGQWLSVGMIVVGAVLAAVAGRLSTQRFGGWGDGSAIPAS